jgi:hypothetical protein
VTLCGSSGERVWNIRSDSVSARTASTSNQTRRAERAHRNPSPAPERARDARDCGRPQPESDADAPSPAWRLEHSGANHHTGNRRSLIQEGSAGPFHRSAMLCQSVPGAG